MALSLPADASRRDFLRITGLGAVGLGPGRLRRRWRQHAAPASSAAAAPAAGQFGDISVQLSWIKNIEFAGEYFADTKGYYTEAGFSEGRPGRRPGGQRRRAGRHRQGRRRPVRPGRHRPVIAEQGGAAEDHRHHVPEEPVLHPVAGRGQADQDARGPGRQEDRRPGRHQRALFNGLLKANDIDPATSQVVVQYDPTPLTERRSTASWPTHQRADPGQGAGLHPGHAAFADNGLPLGRRDVHRAAGHDRQRARQAQGVPDRRDQGLDGRGRRPGRRGAARRRRPTARTTAWTSPSRPSRPRRRTS